MAIRENIIKLRDKYQITQEQLADIAGVSRGAVSQWEGGFSEPRMGAIQKMADYFKITKSNLIEDNGMDEVVYPLVPGSKRAISTGKAYAPLKAIGKVHAGIFEDEEQTDRDVCIPADVANNHPGCFVLTVEGNCMNKVIPEGSHVLIDPRKQPSNGSIVVVETEDYQAIIRRWYKGSQTLMLTTDSYEEYEDIVFSEENINVAVKLLGVVVWYQAAEEMG